MAVPRKPGARGCRDRRCGSACTPSTGRPRRHGDAAFLARQDRHHVDLGRSRLLFEQVVVAVGAIQPCGVLGAGSAPAASPVFLSSTSVVRRLTLVSGRMFVRGWIWPSSSARIQHQVAGGIGCQCAERLAGLLQQAHGEALRIVQAVAGDLQPARAATATMQRPASTSAMTQRMGAMLTPGCRHRRRGSPSRVRGSIPPAS